MSEWRRPDEFFDGPAVLFASGVEPGDIHQGMLGSLLFCLIVLRFATSCAHRRLLVVERPLCSIGARGVDPANVSGH